jgi:methyl-accepting chemotaxis protein
MLQNFKIGIRLVFGFSILMLITIVISGIAVSSYSKINKKVDVITDDKWPKAVILRDV